MIYSRTAKYAALALAEVARRSEDAFVSTQAIAAATSIPYPHFAKPIGLPKRAGLLGQEHS